MSKKSIVFIFIAFFSQISFAQKTPLDHDAQISKSVTDNQVQALAKFIRANGYSCKSISAVTPFAFSSGWRVTCNNWHYAFEVQDQGGKLVVKPD